MCGLVGMAGNIGVKQGRMFRDMLVFDQVRGFDSTGVAFIENGQWPVGIEKEVGGPDNLWVFNNDSEFDDKGLIKFAKRALIGHNRFATTGKVNKINAHPFKFGDITGAHNGSLTYWKNLEDSDKFDVDSKAIFNTIDKKGIDHCWDKLYGAAALTWWDAKAQTINLIRNSQRPLYVSFSELDDCVYWASEEWMIRVSASRAGLKLKERKDKEGNWANPIFQLEVNHLHTFKPTWNTHGLKEVREIEKKSLMQNTGTTGPMGFWGKKKGETNTQTGHLKTGNTSKKGINFGWAKNLDKAPKNLRGKSITLKNHLTFTNKAGKPMRAIVFDLDGDEVRLYCNTWGHLQDWRDRLKSTLEYRYVITERPRIDTHSKIPPIAGSVYALGENSIKFIQATRPKEVIKKKVEALQPLGATLPHFYGLVTPKRWHQIMNGLNPTYSCSCCSEVTTEQDAKEIVWTTQHTFVCKICADNIAKDKEKLKEGKK